MLGGAFVCDQVLMDDSKKVIDLLFGWRNEITLCGAWGDYGSFVTSL